jgi:hypothetical protein
VARRRGRYGKSAQKLVAVLLTTDAGAQINVRIERARLRHRELPGLSERSHGCRQAAVVLQRLFDDPIDGIGMEQSPPISFDLSAKGNVLHFVALRGVLGAKRIARVYRAPPSGGRAKSRPGAANQTYGACQRDVATTLCAAGGDTLPRRGLHDFIQPTGATLPLALRNRKPAGPPPGSTSSSVWLCQGNHGRLLRDGSFKPAAARKLGDPSGICARRIAL